MRFFCVFVVMRLRFFFFVFAFFMRFRFFAFSFFFLRFRFFFFFLRLRSLKYASSFSEICVFVLQQKRKRCQLRSGEYRAHIHKNLSSLTSQVHTQNLRSCFNLRFQIEEFVGVLRCKIYILKESHKSKHNVRIRTLA